MVSAIGYGVASRTYFLSTLVIALCFTCPAVGQSQTDLDVSGKAPLQLLPDNAPEAAGIIRRSNTLLVAQFNHNGRTYLAEIPTSHIARSFVAVSIFARTRFGLFAHLWGVFEAEPGYPVRLFEEKATAPFSELKGFVYSFNYAAEKGVGYNPLFGLLPVYQSSHNLRSPKELADYVHSMDVQIEAPSTRFYEIDYSAEENQRFAETLIGRGSRAQLSQTYNTLCANCSNAVFDALNAVRAHAPGILPTCGYVLSNALVASPARSPVALYARNLVRRVHTMQELTLFAD
jgi:hypothetical protein